MNDDDAMEHLQKHRDLSVHQMKNITYNDNFYNCIGTYTVKRKDIMFMTDDWGEMEVVVNPKDVKLIDYRFLNIFDYMTQKLVLNFLKNGGTGGTKVGRSGVLNIDYFYAKCRRLVEKVVIDKPKSIIQSLTNARKDRDWVMEVINTFYQGDMGIGFLAYEDDYDSSRKKYYIAHMNKEHTKVDYEFA